MNDIRKSLQASSSEQLVDDSELGESPEVDGARPSVIENIDAA